ncbi:hypothetical protein [Nocardioides jejuensis]|uniref:Uncharacterized protein n=1 Tax=Nocardioides jejuensis TaxID=2502782 RepID=A0A4V2NXJ8_9ACTN|nr:hypothetical protein [Nocardioides jejuensis]TCJ21582.1 hypothetical protein EPD65_14695 [Nocardioides jejuensis]
MKLRVLAAIAVLVALLGLLARCPTSAGQLESDVRDLPGVLAVSAGEAEGDDAIPFMNIPKEVQVRMTASSTADQVFDVVSAYDDEGKNLNGVQITFRGRPHVAFYGQNVSHAMINDVVAARDDPGVRSYQMTGSADGFWLQMTVTPRPLAELVAAMEQRRAIPGSEDIDVSTALGRGVIWDPLNDNLAVTRARIDFALEMDEHVPLAGAAIGGRGPLALFVEDAQLSRAIAYVKRHRTAEMRRVLINPHGDPPW